MRTIRMLATRNYIILNKTISKELGINSAILLGELCSEYEYWESQDMLIDGYFFSTTKNIEENTTLTRKLQDTAILKLKEKGIIETKLMGLPAKRYFRINEEKLERFLVCP